MSKLFYSVHRQSRRSCRLFSQSARNFSNKDSDDSHGNDALGNSAETESQEYGRLKFRSPWSVLKEEVKSIKGAFTTGVTPLIEFPREAGLLILGGGLVGNSVAYWIKKQHPKIDVTILERDYGYTRSASMLSAGGIRHQFSLKENIQMSMFTTEFIRNIRDHLSVLDHEPPDVQFNHQGYLFLATAEQAENLEECVKLQSELGAKTTLMSPEKLAQKFPWINLDGVEVGSYGLQGEGWFDPWLLLKGFRQKNVNTDVLYVEGELMGFEKLHIPESQASGDEAHSKLNIANVKDRDGKMHQMHFSTIINCAGPWAGEVARMAGIGTEDSMGLSIPLPVEPRKRFVYVVHCPSGPGLEAPFTIDTTGAYFRREGLGGCYICGCSPEPGKEPDTSNLDVDYEFYDEVVWPRIAYRFPQFERSKLRSAWAGYYDYNYVDQNLIIGRHPEVKNMYFANGMSGHGLQQSIAIGRAISELIFFNSYQTIDLTRFGFDRIFYDEPLEEHYIV